MAQIAFTKATRTKKKWRLLLRGTSGSGKTTSALMLADQLKEDGRIAFVDTEKLSSAHNADQFDFDVIDYTQVAAVSKYPGHHPENYIRLVDMAVEAGHKVLIIDSFSHVWMSEGGILEIVQNLTELKYKGNSYRAWSEGNALYQKLVNKILFGNDLHVILTARTKQAYEIVDKKVIKRGMDTQQRDGLDYEFDAVLNFENDKPGYAIPEKDRTSIFSKEGEQINAKTGKRLLDYIK